jgi:hypothetical protein
MGCSESEIALIEADQGRPLPAVYRCFLTAMGRDLGGLFDGALLGYPYILGSRNAALNLLDDDGGHGEETFALPDDALVVSMHDQGYAFQFVRTSLGDNPPVELWTEGPDMARTTVIADSVAEWVRQAYRSETSRRRDDSRRHRQNFFRRAFDPPMCPACGADWSRYNEVQMLPNAARINNASVVECRTCGCRSHWWWGVQPRLIS